MISRHLHDIRYFVLVAGVFNLTGVIIYGAFSQPCTVFYLGWAMWVFLAGGVMLLFNGVTLLAERLKGKAAKEWLNTFGAYVMGLFVLTLGFACPAWRRGPLLQWGLWETCARQTIGSCTTAQCVSHDGNVDG